MSDPNTPTVNARNSRPQFGLGTIFGMFFALALYFAYLRQIDAAAVLYGCVAIGMGLVVGGTSGLIAGHLVDAVYWAALCSALGYVATAGESTLGTAFHLAWAGVGTAAGAAANLVGPNRPVRRVFVAGLGAALVMGTYPWIVAGTAADYAFDAICAPIVGALIGVLIEILQRLEADRRLPRYTIATWLLCAVMAGNLAVELFVRAPRTSAGKNRISLAAGVSRSTSGSRRPGPRTRTNMNSWASNKTTGKSVSYFGTRA